MQVLVIDPLTDGRWTALASTSGAGLFHSPPWMAALRHAYGFEPRACVAVSESGALLGGIAFCEVDDLLGRRLVSLPFSDVCDPLLPHDEAWPSLRAWLVARRVPLIFRCLGDSPLTRDTEFIVSKRARWHTLSLDAPATVLRERFGDTTRRAIAKAERAGVTVRPLEGDRGFDGFVRMHAQLRKRKYRMLAQPPGFFGSIAREFQPIDGWHPLGAWHGETLIAATVYLKWGDTLYYKFNASDPGGLSLRPNNLLVWAGLELAVSLGCTALDLGPSDDNQPGLIRFKREFGSAERELRFLRRSPAGYQGETGAELRPVLGEVTRLLTLPGIADDLTASAGATLYRYFA